MTKKQTSEDLGLSASSAAPRRKPGASRKKHVAAEPVEPQAVVAAQPVYQPAHEEIALLAYSYWEARGCQGGSSEEDWLRAERELREATRTTAVGA